MAKKSVAILVVVLAAMCIKWPLFSSNLSPQTPVFITMDGSGGDPTVAANSLGFLTTWRDNTAEATSSFSTNNGQTWSSPINFDSSVTGMVTVIAQDTKFVASYVKFTEATNTVMTSVSNDGLSWTMPVSISMGAGVNPPVEAAATNAGFMTTWVQQNFARTSFSFDGINWNPPVQIPSMFQVNRIDIAGNSKGYIVAITDDMVDIGYVSFSSDQGATWGTPVQVSPIADGQRLAVGGNESGFLAVWPDSMGNLFSSFSSNNGANWSAPNQIPTPDGNAGIVDISANNTAFVATWIAGGDVPQASCSTDNGSTWSSPVSFAQLSAAFDSIIASSVARSNVIFTWRATGNHVVSSYSTFPFAFRPNLNTNPFYRQITPNRPGRQFFE